MSDYKLIDVTRLTKFKEKLLGILTYSSPEADATNTSIEFIDTVSQSNGKISASKKKVSTFAGGNTAGLVPASGTNASDTFLGSDGKWSKPTGTTYNNYTTSTANKTGVAGLVPAPGTGDVGKFLKGGSGWSDLPTASTTNSGIVSLNSSTNSDAENVAATPKAVKAVYAAASTAGATAGANAGANAASSYATAAKNSASNASTYATNAKNSADSAADAASTAVTNKIKDLKYDDPSASTASTATSTTFISNISQSNGVISATKKTLPLSNTVNNDVDKAATPKAVNDAIKNLSYTDPTDGTATSTSTTFISNISQSDGVISATKKKLPTFAGSSQSGIVSASEGLSENYLLNATGGWTAINEELDATSTNPVQNKTLYNLETYHTLTYVGNSSYIIDDNDQFAVPRNTSINIYAVEPINNSNNGYVSIYANNVGRYDVVSGFGKHFGISEEKGIIEEYSNSCSLKKLYLSYVRNPTQKVTYSESETPPRYGKYYFTTGGVILKLFFTGEYFIILNNAPLIIYNYKYYHKSDTGVTTFHGIKYADGLIMQWFDNVILSDGVSKIYFPIPMDDASYTITESRKGENLNDVTGHVEKNSEYFTVNPENAHIADFFVIGY